MDVALEGPGAARAGVRRRAWLALLLLVPMPSIGVAFSMVAAPGPVGLFLWGCAKVWILALPYVWQRWAAREEGLWPRPPRGGFGLGVGTGAAMGAAVLVAVPLLLAPLVDVSVLRETLGAQGLLRPGAYLAMAAYIVLVNSLLEEYVWRWFVYRRCEELASVPVAVAASAAAFTLHHAVLLFSQFAAGPAALATAAVAFAGAVWSWVYARTRSIWPGWLSHVIVDVAVLVAGWNLLQGAV